MKHTPKFKCKIIQLLEARENPHDLGFEDEFLATMIKEWSIKEKIDKLDS